MDCPDKASGERLDCKPKGRKDWSLSAQPLAVLWLQASQTDMDWNYKQTGPSAVARFPALTFVGQCKWLAAQLSQSEEALFPERHTVECRSSGVRKRFRDR